MTRVSEWLESQRPSAKLKGVRMNVEGGAKALLVHQLYVRLAEHLIHEENLGPDPQDDFGVYTGNVTRLAERLQAACWDAFVAFRDGGE